MGPPAQGGSPVLLDPNGDPVTLITSPAQIIVASALRPPHNQGGSFPLQIKLDPDNQLELTLHDESEFLSHYLRGWNMTLIEVAPIPPPTFRIIDVTTDGRGEVTITWERDAVLTPARS